jgi:hypothetical protein
LHASCIISTALPFALDIPHLHHPFHLSMFTPQRELTQEEQILHHYAAIFSKRLETYRACESRNEETWIDEFRKLLV